MCMCADVFSRKRADDCPNVRCSFTLFDSNSGVDEGALTVLPNIRPSSTLIYTNSGVDEGALTVLPNIRPSSTLIYPNSGVDEGVQRCFYLLVIVDRLSPSTNYSLFNF